MTEEIRKKIEERFSYLATFSTEVQEGFQQGAEFGYSLSLEELEQLKSELSELKSIKNIEVGFAKGDANIANGEIEEMKEELSELKAENERLIRDYKYSLEVLKECREWLDNISDCHSLDTIAKIDSLLNQQDK